MVAVNNNVQILEYPKPVQKFYCSNTNFPLLIKKVLSSNKFPWNGEYLNVCTAHVAADTIMYLYA